MPQLKPDYSVHVLQMFWRFILLPVTVGRWVCGLLLAWFSTADSRRASDSLRQSRVRRTLRGLTPDHDPTRDDSGARQALQPTPKGDPLH